MTHIRDARDVEIIPPVCRHCGLPIEPAALTAGAVAAGLNHPACAHPVAITASGAPRVDPETLAVARWAARQLFARDERRGRKVTR